MPHTVLVIHLFHKKMGYIDTNCVKFSPELDIECVVFEF